MPAKRTRTERVAETQELMVAHPGTAQSRRAIMRAMGVSSRTARRYMQDARAEWAAARQTMSREEIRDEHVAAAQYLRDASLLSGDIKSAIAALALETQIQSTRGPLQIAGKVTHDHEHKGLPSGPTAPVFVVVDPRGENVKASTEPAAIAEADFDDDDAAEAP